MRVRRGLLFWGLLLIPLGAIPLLVRAGQLDATQLGDAWRFWPLIVIAIGIAIIGSRTALSLVGLAVMALTIGSIGGAAIASGSFSFAGFSSCGVASTEAAVDQTGAFSGPAAVRLDLNCGSVDFRATQDTGWTLHAAYRGNPPLIDATGTRLEVRTPSGNDRRQDWTIAVPAASLQSLELRANASTSSADLGSATVDELQANVNAGDVRLVARSATVRRVDAEMNAGRLRLTLGSAGTTGELSVNAGAIDLCVPDGVALRFDVEDQLTFVTNLSSRGLSRDGDVWTRGGGGATIDLAIKGNAASFTLNPNGGC